MLSSVLNSKRAIEVNIAIMHAFVKLREILESNEELNRKFTFASREEANAIAGFAPRNTSFNALDFEAANAQPTLKSVNIASCISQHTVY